VSGIQPPSRPSRSLCLALHPLPFHHLHCRPVSWPSGHQIAEPESLSLHPSDFLDNIFIERLWRSLKYEAVYLHELTSGLEARGIIGWPGNRELGPKQSPRSRRAGERQGASRYDRTGVAEPASRCRWLNASSIHPGRWSPRTTTAFRFDRDR